MMLLDFIKSNQHFEKWYQKLLWWEVMRIPYNLIMLLLGIGSLAIAAVSIPALYFLIGLGLNFIYTFFGITEIFNKELSTSQELKSHRKRNFFGYIIFSAVNVYSFPILIRLVL